MSDKDKLAANAFRYMLDNPDKLIDFLVRNGATDSDLDGLFSEIGEYRHIDWHA